MTQDMNGRLMYAGEIRKYILGGNSCFTIQIGGEHRTYKVKSLTRDKDANWTTNNQDRSKYFVSFKSGPDDSFEDYSYMGMLTQQPDGDYKLVESLKSKARKGSHSWDMFDYLWLSIEQACRVPTDVEFYHEGSCCMCGRQLTHPESVASGIGPECAGKA